ncbi:MAG: TIGR04282 family arsenosugar biosynthesis glycosyltransferase [Ignavibacteria bacterium]|nr:TIGR04282 family arsenosugar biosynthesis glycosyltransferase [Ignavibacteria bacterium]
MKTSLLVFARYPHLGKVKTRLAASIGDVNAKEFYTSCAELTYQNMYSMTDEVDVTIYYSERLDEYLMKDWVDMFSESNSIIPQSGNDLGERMKNAFMQTFDRFPHQSAIIIGTDTPDITPEIILQAKHLLESHDVVIGPANDGGYYLLGMNTLHASLFESIDWSTPKVYEQTIQKAEKLNCNVAILEQLTDIDTVDDMQLWLQQSTSLTHPLYNIASRLITYE